MPRNPTRANPLAKLVLVTAVAGLLVAGAAVRPAPAQAASPCWKPLLNDWYDGRIDQTYPVHCYREALKHLPADVQTYSSAHDDILRALQSRDREGQEPSTSRSAATPLVPPATKTTARLGLRHRDDHDDRVGRRHDRAARTAAGSPARSTRAARRRCPSPLIVLGALALLLVAAGGAGLIAKRIQSRRPSP